jgi:hypothetical protein
MRTAADSGAATNVSVLGLARSRGPDRSPSLDTGWADGFQRFS